MHRTGSSATWLASLLTLTLALMFGTPTAAVAQPSPTQTPLRFGILPFGGAVESRNDWRPLLADLSRAIGWPVSVLSVTSYESLDQAIRRNEVDIALLTAKMALDAVTEGRMRVLAQVRRPDGAADHRAVLLALDQGPDLAAVLAQPARWRLARGDSRSVSGFMVPQLQLFLPRGISIETAFAADIVGTHQDTALAVANGNADVATNNTTDLERFGRQFPIEAARLKVIWQSTPTPQAQIVMRSDSPPALQQKLCDFLAAYGRGKDGRGDAEREVLRSLHAALGYEPADNTALLPAAALDYQLAWQRALHAKWVNDAAREARLKRIQAAYAAQVDMLRAPVR